MESEERARASFDAWQRGDIEWLVANSSPEIVIRQPVELPDSKSYFGHEGVREAFADWPKQWESFEITEWKPHRVDTPNAIVVETSQHLRARGGLEFDLVVFNVFAYDDDGIVLRWEMFLEREPAFARLQSLVPR